MSYFSITLAASLVIALAVPTVLVSDRHVRLPVPLRAETRPITPSKGASVDEALRRGLFASDSNFSAPLPDAERGEVDSAASADLPSVVGVVGRLPDQAVVLVRRASGGTRSIGIGDTVDGWSLRSIAPDAVLFTQGERSERVEITKTEPTAPDQ